MDQMNVSITISCGIRAQESESGPTTTLVKSCATRCGGWRTRTSAPSAWRSPTVEDILADRNRGTNQRHSRAGRSGIESIGRGECTEYEGRKA